MVVHPAVLLLDEPLSALDAQTRELLMEEMLAIWRNQPTTRIYVTHNLDEALRLADRVAVLSRRPGRLRDIVSVDLPLAQRTDPAHAPYLASLHQRLWSSIRDEALVADREVAVA
jgi:NitT/TauT family transport system ATP-binding protein